MKAFSIGAWLGVALLVVVACHDDSTAFGDCSNGACTCFGGHTCDFSCAAPPCQIICAAGSTCAAACADGTCTCEPGASCSFACNAPPCHVTCEGQNARCDGVCADGTCTCGPGAACNFVCFSAPCHATCAAGSRCALQCPAGLANMGNCEFDVCDGGPSTVCSDGRTVTCNLPCPNG